MVFEVFISYAIEDLKLCKALEKHLAPLAQRNIITLWKDSDINPGSEWQAQIKDHLNRAHIILLLISSHFMDTDFCYNDQMQRALERHKAKKARVIPIILRPVGWEDAPFSHLQVLPLDGEIVKPVTQWRLRDEAYVNIAKGVEATVEELKELKEAKKTRKSTRTPAHPSNVRKRSSRPTPGGNTQSQPAVWNVPFRRDPYFTGREEILVNLHALLAQEHETAITQPSAINGLGGIGKTHTAIEYAYRYKSEYQYVLWVQADTNETLIADYVSLAQHLGCTRQNIQKQEHIINDVKHWLENNTRWLLIFDNVNDLHLIDKFLPMNIQGHVLITTRMSAMSGLARNVEIDKLSIEEGALFLLHRTDPLTLDIPLADMPEVNRTAALAIVKEMDCLPLALDQAAAYIEETGQGLTNYLEIYKQHRADLLKNRGERLTHPDSVTTTFDMAFKNVQQTNPAAADLLRLCAFLAPDAIPEELFTQLPPVTDILYQFSTYINHVPWQTSVKIFFKSFVPRTSRTTNTINIPPELETALQTFVGNPHTLNVAIKDLRKFSLIRRDSRDHTLFIHRLVQAVLQDELNKQIRQQWEMLTVQTMAQYFPDPGNVDIDINARQQRQRTFPHALQCVTYIQSGNVVSLAATRLLNNVGMCLFDLAQYQDAEQYLQMGISISKKVLGLAFPLLLGNLGKLYEIQSKYKEAKKLYQQASKNSDALFGLPGNLMMEMNNNEAQLYESQGKYREAEELCKQTLAIREELLGDEHPLIASTLGDLGAIYYYQGRYQEAVASLQKSRLIYESKSGLEHPELATSLGSLAITYTSMGKYKEAAPLFEQSLVILEKAYGKDHPRVAQTLHNMAMFYSQLNRDDEAISLIQRALVIREKQLGADHPLTATSFATLATLYSHQEKYTLAEPLYEKALAINEKMQGPKHYTSSIMGSLAGVYIEQHKYKEAEQLALQALSIQEKSLGLQHPDAASILSTLGRLYARQGLHKKAKDYLQQALSINEQTLGSEHPALIYNLENLAAIYIAMDRLDEAEQLIRRGLIICKTKQGIRNSAVEALKTHYNTIQQRRQRRNTTHYK